MILDSFGMILSGLCFNFLVWLYNIMWSFNIFLDILRDTKLELKLSYKKL